MDFYYLGFGLYQNSVALNQAKKLAKYRNHDFEKILANQVWKYFFMENCIFV